MELARLTLRRAMLDAQLAERMTVGNELEARTINDRQELALAGDDYGTWNDFNVTLLKKSFTTAEEADKYGQEGIFIGGLSTPSWGEVIADFRGPVHTRVQRLASLKERLGLFDEPGSTEAPGSTVDASRTDVFIVHGHDGEAKLTVARFVEQVTFRRPIILHEQPNRGRTIIEKFEEVAATTAFAIVLLTGDDVGSAVHAADTNPRARQNVLFEMGFFVGAVGRDRVAILYEDGVELPSDVSGLLYTRLDAAGAWKLELAREMREASISVDLNAAT